MSDNGNRKGDENDKDRDENGRFIPGKPGGPGRGITKSRQELSEAIEEIKTLLQDNGANLTSSKTLAPVGRVLLHGITATDPKVRTDSAKLYFVWLPKMNEAEEREKGEDNLPSPEDIDGFTMALKIKAGVDIMKAERETLCCDCKKKLGIDEGLKEITHAE